MGSPCAFFYPLQKATAHPWAAMVFNQARQQSGEPLIKSRESVGGVVLQNANIDPSFNNRAIGPDIGPTQVGYPKNFNVFLVRHGSL
jgi:hypothetical protein